MKHSVEHGASMDCPASARVDKVVVGKTGGGGTGEQGGCREGGSRGDGVCWIVSPLFQASSPLCFL